MPETHLKTPTPPSLIRRLGYHTLFMMAAVLFCALTAVIGLQGLNTDFSTADDTHLELRYIYETGYQLSRLRELNESGNMPAMRMAFQRTISSAEQLKERPEYLREEEVRQLLSSIDQLKNQSHPGTDKLELQAQINGLLGQIAQLSQRIGARLEATRLSARQRYTQTVWIVILLASVTLIFTAIISLRLRQRISTPLMQLAEAAQSYQALAHDSPDKRYIFISPEAWQGGRYREFDQLAKQLNAMAEELGQLYETLENKVQIQSRQLITQERLASLGQLAAGIAHEINNPLAIIANYGQVLARDLKNISDTADQPSELKKQQQAIHIIVEEAFRCKQLTDKLLVLARNQTQEHGHCRLDAALKHIAQLCRGLADADKREICFSSINETTSVAVHEADLIQILLNLISNAIYATDENGKIEIDGSVQGETAALTIRDNGIGMDNQQMDQIFEPFYSKRKEQRMAEQRMTEQTGGVGLGLSITHALIEKNGGSITVNSKPENGTTFTVTLPISVQS